MIKYVLVRDTALTWWMIPFLPAGWALGVRAPSVENRSVGGGRRAPGTATRVATLVSDASVFEPLGSWPIVRPAQSAQGSCGCGANCLAGVSGPARRCLSVRRSALSPCTFAGPTLTRKSGTEIQGKWTVPAGDMIHGGNLSWLG